MDRSGTLQALVNSFTFSSGGPRRAGIVAVWAAFFSGDLGNGAC